VDDKKLDPAQVYRKVIPGNVAAIASDETDEAEEIFEELAANAK
jgi:hypothetical protein